MSVATRPNQTAFSWPIRVYWEDTDAGGIVFYANYLKFFERARTEWLRSLGINQQALRDDSGGQFVVTDAKLHYVQSARLDDQLDVTAQLVELGRASLVVVQQAFARQAEGGNQPARLLCEGEIRIGWVDATTLKPQRLPPQVRDTLPQPPVSNHAHAATPRNSLRP